MNDQKFKLTPLEKSWILYDVGNSAFTMLACSLVTVWFKSLATGQGVSETNATAYWSYAASIVTILVALIGPVCGTIADNKGFKKPIFITSLSIGVLTCVATGLISNWFAFLVVFIVSKVAYQACNVFYDSMLTDVTESDRMDTVSSHGYAWGYIGSCIPFAVALVFYMAGEGMLGGFTVSPTLAKIVGFGVTGIWWFLVSVPLLVRFRQKYCVVPRKGAIAECFLRLGATLKKIVKEDKKVFYFLIAFFLYIDGVHTIIDDAVNVGTFLGLNDVGLIILLLATQVVAFAFSLVFAKLSKKYQTVNLLLVCIVGYFCVAVYAIFLKTMLQFAIMAFGVGMFQGAIQALSRSYFGKIIPPDNAGEYFGLYDIFSKGAAFLGTLVVAVVTQLTDSINLALGCLAFFFVAGFFFLRKADRTDSGR